MSKAGYVRLHVAPLTPVLLKIILPAQILPLARNISYHNIQTFPDRPYGFLELPEMEANKLKKKLNGTTLKGSKVKIEQAKLERRKKDLAEDVETSEPKASEKVRDRKRRRSDGAIPGYELPETRKVRRGWTEPADSKTKSRDRKDKDKMNDRKSKTLAKSAHSDEAELLFKSVIPPNKRLAEDTEATEVKSKQRKKRPGETVVHEFEKRTTHPSFLRSVKGAKNSKTPVEFVDGKGWVDEHGDVVEEVRTTRSTRSTPGMRKVVLPENEVAVDAAPAAEDETSSSGSSDPDSDSPAPEERENHDQVDTEESRFEEQANLEKMTLKGLPNISVEPVPAPHPLEALFKRPQAPKSTTSTPKKPNLDIRVPFTFSRGDGDVKDNETGAESRSKKATLTLNMPQTPFTERDMQFRSLRSAAPTPDTAAPQKMGFGNVWGPASDIEEEDEDEGGMQESENANDAEPKEESDFAKEFWEKRGENNRAWKRRRREAGKEKKRQINKRRAKPG